MILLKVLHKKNTSKRYSWLHVDCLDDPLELASTSALKARRFTILWERDARVLGSEKSLCEQLHVGDTFLLLEDKASLTWRRYDLLFLKQETNAEMVEQYRSAGHSQPFQPIPPPPKDAKESDEKDRDISIEYCKHWINSRQCPFSKSCPRVHPEGEELKRIRDEWVAEKRLRRRDLSQSAHDPHLEKSSKASKARIFADFLVKTFNISTDSESGTILDVAGGRGTISIELFLRYSVKSVLIDPRDDCLRGLKYQERILKDTLSKESRKSSHLKEWFTRDFFKQHPDLLGSCALIFGMHPDQATEPIVDVALKAGIPFAIVPCCVFANENSTRRLKSGKQVVVYEDFLLYLREKDPGIEEAFLPFEGRNLCLYKV